MLIIFGTWRLFEYRKSPVFEYEVYDLPLFFYLLKKHIKKRIEKRTNKNC